VRTPHTHYTKGKTVWLKMRDGATMTGKFLERKGRFVHLQTESGNVKVIAGMIRAMSFRRKETT